MRGNKGITLIALIITIIVLLIIAGVTIATLTGNHGILTQADAAKVTTIEGEVTEAVRLAVQTARLNIANKAAIDASYDATANIATDIIGVMDDDLTTTRGYTFSTPSSNSFTITYTGENYKKATNKTTASITYTITVEQQGLQLSDTINYVK